jgi:hypothetical protein
VAFYAISDGQRTDVTNIAEIAAGQGSPYFPLSARILTNDVVVEPPSAGWRVAFSRPEDRRWIGTYMLHLTPPQAQVTVIITNGTSMPVEFEWLEWTTNWYAHWTPNN